jgi:hypothetical protein
MKDWKKWFANLTSTGALAAKPVKATKKPRSQSTKRMAINDRLIALGLTMEPSGGQWRLFLLDPVHGRVETTYCPNLAYVEEILTRLEANRALV